MALNLITDRTSSDVAYAKSFQGREWDKLSSEQKAEYLLGLRGAYSYTDFNRVENAVQYLSDLLNSYGYKNKVNTKTDWTADDIQKISEIQRYIDNIAELKDKYYSNVEGEMPTTSTWLTVEGANYLEKILTNIYELLIAMSGRFIYSGVANSGANKLWQQRFRRSGNWFTLTYSVNQLNQNWNTVSIPKEDVAAFPVGERDDIYSTINLWNKTLIEIDKKVEAII